MVSPLRSSTRWPTSGTSRVSAREYVLATVDKCGAAIEAGESDEVMLSWRKAFCSTIFIFRLVPVDMIRFEVMNLRKKTLNDAKEETWTALQRVQAVVSEAQLMTNPTAARVSVQFMQNVHFSKT